MDYYANFQKKINFFVDKKINLKSKRKILCAFVIATLMSLNIQEQAKGVPVPMPKSNDSVYNLVKVNAPGENVITKYEWSNTENKFVPVYYRVDLTKSEYGHAENASDKLYFKFEKRDGVPVLVESDEQNYDLVYFVDENRLANDRVITNQNIDNDFVGMENKDGLGVVLNEKQNIKKITGDFVSNTATGEQAGGAAICNKGQIDEIKGNFINNSAVGSVNDDPPPRLISSLPEALGGAIYNGTIYNSSYSSALAVIGSITGNFIGNSAEAVNSAMGGAIYNEGIIENLNSHFVANNATATSGVAAGGAIVNNEGLIAAINGDFVGNSAVALTAPTYQLVQPSNAMGGAIYNDQEAEITNITGDFIGNYALGADSSYGGAIYNSYFSKIGGITGDFIGNHAQGSEMVMGGAISNTLGLIGSISGDFINNKVVSEYGLAVGGAIANMGILGTMEFEPVPSDTRQASQVVFKPGEIINSSFINNTAEVKDAGGMAAGGAIFSVSDLNITADNGVSLFKGNKTVKNGVEQSNAISIYGFGVKLGDGTYEYRDLAGNVIGNEEVYKENPVSLTLKAVNNGIVQFDDKIQGGAIAVESEEEAISLLQKETAPSEDLSNSIIKDPTAAFNLKVTGDKTGKVILNNDVINARISLDETNLYLGRDDVFNQSQSLTLNSGSMSMINNQAGTMNIPTFNLNGTTNLGVDVDLANKQMDTIKATNYNVAEGAKLNVNNINLLNDAKQDKTDILFTDNKDLASATAYTGASPIAYSPIYKYEVSYNPDDGFFTFLRGGGSGNPSDNFNPSVLAPSVAQQAGAYTTQLQTFNFAFQHADSFMNIPYLERVAMKHSGHYALSPTGDTTDVGTFSPLLTKEDTSGFWVKPYASFENIPLNNGPKVSNINYGTLVGYDSSLTPIAKGWERVLTGYIGYNGASQRYSGVDAYQNGGILGGTATLYKGNFFNATTLSVGATAGDASTMYGNENYAMLLAGVGNKTGYNFEFKDGRIILQPNFLISYTFVNTFDYTNGAGVRIKSDPLNAIQLAPGLKLIGNTKNGWQPYLSVAMVWNLLDDSKVTANDVRLPEMSIDPYVQYGAGIQKRFKDRFIAFGQAMIHNGGRNGVSLTGGIRWTVGN